MHSARDQRNGDIPNLSWDRDPLDEYTGTGKTCVYTRVPSISHYVPVGLTAHIVTVWKVSEEQHTLYG